MKKCIANFEDIETLFLMSDMNKNSNKTEKGITNENKQIKKLEKELEEYKKRNLELEKNLDSLRLSTEGKFRKKDVDDIGRMFLTFDSEEFCDSEIKKTVNKLKEENKSLVIENKKLIKIKENNEELIKSKSFKKTAYKDIIEKLREKYGSLSENSITAVATAEYLYINETDTMIDYTGVYVNYVKALEIELKRVFRIEREKTNFGDLIKKLSEDSLFRTFVQKLEHEKVLMTRNKSVHQRPISKVECGKIRKLLIEDNWLDRISFLVEESLKERNNKELFFEGVIGDKIGFLNIDGIKYNRYETDLEIDVISSKNNLKGEMKLAGISKIYKNEEFILIK